MNQLGRVVPNDPGLAVSGGIPVRQSPMPVRRAMGQAEIAMIQQVLSYYGARGMDPGYEGHFERLYTAAFAEVMGGGYADAVATGTSALYIAIAALNLPKGSQVIVSPVTDPGTLSAIILNGLVPRLADSKHGNYNMGAAEFSSRISSEVTAAVVVHAAGQATEIDEIVTIARAHGIKVVEDCAQSHRAMRNGSPVGTFGDIAAFSTMYRKAHMSGPSGGIVYSRDLALFRAALIHADRGKPRWRDDFDDRDPTTYLAPALNHNTDEISCAIGCASLARLGDTIARRMAFFTAFAERLAHESRVCQAYPFETGDSPFFVPVTVDAAAIRCSKTDFALAVRAEGIDLNPHYKYLVCEWPFVRPYLADDFQTPAARQFRDSTFNLFVNENYGEQEAVDAVAAIKKVERAMACR